MFTAFGGSLRTCGVGGVVAEENSSAKLQLHTIG